ncbi:hypothetical protein [Nitratireductor pacificus]|uniref:hypothetical protein n=1 Tax=Nitratireductor pacificus TaxID=1231180 RepID=UPI00178C4CC1|nr:hypothetical protein [Nitratireductor pacificus]
MKHERDSRKQALDSLSLMLHPPGGAHRNYQGALSEIRQLETMPMTGAQRSTLQILRSEVEPYTNDYGARHPIHWAEFSDAWISVTGELILP